MGSRGSQTGDAEAAARAGRTAGTGAIVVMVTAPGLESATGIARALVTEGLAACVNIVPGVRSIYVWDGKLCDDSEALCVAKTRRDLFDRLRTRVIELHPYDVPEVLAFDLDDGNASYLEWVRGATRADGGGGGGGGGE